MKFRNCKWCNNEFPVKHRNHKYCSENCQREARLERQRGYRRDYYKKFGFLEKKNGTTHIGPHRNESTNTETRVIKNEMYRTFSKKLTLYNEGKSENFSRTHIKITFSKNLILNKEVKSCPECSGTKILKDYNRAEIFCGSCGLVLLAPPHYGIVYPYKEYYIPKQEDDRMDHWTTWYVNDWKPEKETIPSSLNNTSINIVCGGCYGGFEILKSEKKSFNCPVCGSTKALGVGICLPHDYIKDEFEEETEPSGYDLTNNSD